MKFNNLEDKCRYYQSLTDYRILPNSYILCHIDGRSFSKLIKNNFERPFDDAFINMMNETAKYLCEEVQGCKMAYVQSDEISLLLTDINDEGNNGTVFFEGRLNKMQSIIASLATAKFNQMLTINEFKRNGNKLVNNLIDGETIIENMNLAQFDCKVWVVPNLNDAYAWFLFRNIDCVRNSKQQTAQTYISHNKLVGKNTDEQLKILLDETDIDWNSYAKGKKYGRFIHRVKKPMAKVFPDNSIIEFVRNVWTVEDGFNLTVDGSKDRILEYINYGNKDCAE